MKGAAKRYTVTLPDMKPGQLLKVRYVDQQRGSPLPAWRAMGSSKLPTMAQIDVLRRSAETLRAEVRRLDTARRLTLELPAEGIALIES